MPIKSLTPNRHLQLIKWVLHNIIRVNLIDLLQHDIDVRRDGIRKEKKLDAGDRLEAG